MSEIGLVNESTGPETGTDTAVDDNRYEPRVIVFCCNWCSYAGADLAGVSRFQYPSNVRIIRVNCSGRVEPSMVFKCFEGGIDGLIITGCHPGECHYGSSNEYTKSRAELIRELMRKIGLDERRFRLEWVSASEGRQFSKIMKDFVKDLQELGPIKCPVQYRLPDNLETIQDIIDGTGAFDCVECGKCTSICPMAKVDPTFAPRLLVVKAQEGEGLSVGLEADDDLWKCLTCEVCSRMCPYEVYFSDLVKRLRIISRSGGSNPRHCQDGLLMRAANLRAAQDADSKPGWLTDDLLVADKSDVYLFTGCMSLMETIYSELEPGLDNIARQAVKILNKAGVIPAVSRREVCCGHDFIWSGDEEKGKELGRQNLDAISATGAKTVVFLCPEGLMTFENEYTKFFGEQDLEYLHISEYLLDLLDTGKLKLKGGSENVTFHDPCRLGKYLGIYDSPRELIESVEGVKIVEMEKNKDEGECCGQSLFMNCGKTHLKLQRIRLEEAKATEAEKMITTCPKCKIHFNCALKSEGVTAEEMHKTKIPVEDMVEYIYKYLS